MTQIIADAAQESGAKAKFPLPAAQPVTSNCKAHQKGTINMRGQQMRFQLTAVGMACATLLSACGGGNGSNHGAKAQFINFASPGTQTLPSVPKPLTAETTSKLPITFTSETPTVCTVADGTLIPVKKGVCLIAATQAGDANYQPARVQQVFNVEQAAKQEITFISPGNLMITDTPPALVATSTSGLAVSLTSKTPAVCTVSGATLTLVSKGNCEIVASQSGNNDYPAAADQTVKFFISNGQAPELTFASGYKPWNSYLSNEDGHLDMYAGASSASTVDRASDGSTYTWTLTIPADPLLQWAYQGFKVFAPGVADFSKDVDTAGMRVDGGQTMIKYSVMMNPEWITAGKKAFRVQLYLGHHKKKADNSDCNVKLEKFQDLPFTGPVQGVQEQSMDLKDFVVVEACGLGALDAATELANYPVSMIEFNVPDVNISVKTPGTETYVTRFTVGKIIFK